MTLVLPTDKKRWRDVVQMLPWTLFVGILYSGFAWLYSRILGYEFVSIITPLTLLLLVVVALRFNFLLPKEVREKTWRKLEAKKQSLQTNNMNDLEEKEMSLIKAWLPYGIVVLLLLISRTLPVVKEFLSTTLNLSWYSILGFKEINLEWAVLYSPGFILTLSACIALGVQIKSVKPFTPPSQRTLLYPCKKRALLYWSL